MVKFSYKLVKTDKIVRKDENKHKIIELIPHNDITKEELIDLLKYVYDLENNEKFKDNILLKLKGLNTDLIEESIKYSLTREDLKDPLMILNIINLIKIYNNLNDNFFQDESMYIDSNNLVFDI